MGVSARLWRAVLLAASLGGAAVGPVAAQQAVEPEALPKLEHIDVTAVDTSVSPCENFYQYACGKLNAASPIPPDQIAWGASGKLALWNRAVLRQILEQAEAPAASRSPSEQRIGDFYASCMDQTVDGTAALEPLRPLLSRIDEMRSTAELAGVLAGMHRSFGAAWAGDDNQVAVAVFGFGPTPDFDNVSRVVAGIDQGGLGLPNRDFYLQDDDRSKVIRQAYVAYIARLLSMSGTPAATARSEAEGVLRFETTLARLQMDNISRRDPAKINHRLRLEQVQALTPSFRWPVYLRAVGAPAVPIYEVTSPEFFRGLERQIDTVDLPLWKSYLRWQLLKEAAPSLGASWRQADFDFFRKTLFGAKQMQPDWRRCTLAADRYLGEALGQAYVARTFSPESKARAKALVNGIEAAMAKDIQQVSWMQPKTKAEAEVKLAAIMDKIGYPDHWRDYSGLMIERTGYAGNVERATAFESERQMRKIGRPLDRSEWIMTPPTVDAYEDPQTNTINFPAGILQPIFFDPTEDDVINYGAEGAVIGHELTHGFDDQGRKFDEKGNLRDWWTPEDAKNYDERGACVAREYTGPVPGVEGVTQDGRLTQGEDTADNGGLYLALAALRADLERQGKSLEQKDAHGLTDLQRFFLAYGNSWCETIRPEAARTYVLSNPHSMPELRVNNVVGNMPEFREAFGCKAGQPMVHRTACRVW